MFQTGFLSIIRSLVLYTQQQEGCHTGYADCLLASSQHNLYDIYLLLCVQCQTPDGGQRNCPKHVEFYSKNKFEILAHLVGFIIRIYHDARSSECQIVGLYSQNFHRCIYMCNKHQARDSENFVCSRL